MNAPFRMTGVLRLADISDAAECQRIEDFVRAMGGSPFQRPLWLQAVEQGCGQQAMGLIFERQGAIAGWLPLTDMHSPLFGHALVSSGFAVGGGVLADGKDTAVSLCRAAEELAVRLNASTIELRDSAAPDNWQTISGKHAGFVRELSSDDEAQLLAIPRKARAEVRKGLAGNLDVSIGNGENDRTAHYACYSESVRNLGTPVFPRALFDAVLDAFGDDADILTVSLAGEPISSVLSLYHAGVVLPFWGGGKYAARNLRANERMYYELMCHARKRGCTQFDFGRSKTESGPYFFKKNWGFEPEPLTYRSWTAPGVAARNIDPTDEGYSAKIEVWKKLPLPVANAIGPWIARGLG